MPLTERTHDYIERRWDTWPEEAQELWLKMLPALEGQEISHTLLEDMRRFLTLVGLGIPPKLTKQ